MKRIILASLLLVLYCCNSDNSQTKEKQKSTRSSKQKESINEKQKEVIELNHSYNDISMIIAGIKNERRNSYDKISNSNTFLNYSNKIDRNYEKFKQNKLMNFEKWSKEELNHDKQSSKNLFYPFSGPDIAYAYSMMPEAENYFLYGLEPVGEVPNLNGIKIDALPTLFNSIHSAISDNLNLSFFITKNMKKDLSNNEIKGTIPILMFFMSRMDLHIQNIVPVAISENGKIEYQNGDKFRSGVEISFFRKGSKKLSKVYYFSLDISDYNDKTNSNLRRFTESMNDVTTLVKSSSYCMHTDKYSIIRELTLNCSDVLVQDDTGIPYKFFDPNSWDIQVYGTYVAPISVFSMHKQQDLKERIKQYAKPIDFRFGYNYPSNILVGRKKQSNAQ